MATYAYLCPACGSQYWAHVASARQGPPTEVICDSGHHRERVAMARDYRTEAVGIGAGVKVSREGTNKERDRLFMPDNSDFKGPGDPDGKKGMREWRESHQPRESNHAPRWPGEVERTVF